MKLYGHPLSSCTRKVLVTLAEKGLEAEFCLVDLFTGEQYLAGGTFSLADISLMPYVASLPMIGAERLLGGLPRLGEWWARAAQRASWRRAVHQVA